MHNIPITEEQIEKIYVRAYEDHEAGRFNESKEALKFLVDLKYEPAMCLLAVVLGDINSATYRSEIIALCEEAHRGGSFIAAEILAIQYRQWGEEFMSKLWFSRMPEIPEAEGYD